MSPDDRRSGPARHQRGRSIRLPALLTGVVVFAFAGCFYPDYTFDRTVGQGGSGGSPTTGGMGGAATTSSAHSSSSESSSSGSGGATASSGAGGHLGEICDNGIDDDGDGFIDCADSECTTMACVSAVPQDWTGFFALYDGAIAGDPGCPTSYPSTMTMPYVGNAGLTTPPAGCSACTCTAPTGQTCKPPASIDVQDTACSQNPNCGASLSLGPADGSCYNGAGGSGDYVPSATTCGPNAGANCTTGTQPCNVAVTAMAPTVSGGTCTAKGGVATLPQPTWSTLGRACGDPSLTAGGCNVGQVCLPKPPSPFGTGVCIAHDGDVACPAGAFAAKHVFYGGFDDTRACSGCQCGPASGGTCTATITVYSTSTCTSALATFAAGSCTSIAMNPDVSGRKVTVTQPTGSTCPPNGGEPIGSASPTGPTTFCCVP